MSEELLDPEPPDETTVQIRAKDLKNKVLIVQPFRHATQTGKDDKPWEFVEARVWVLDRQGIEAEYDNVRFSWWHAVAVLSKNVGKMIGTRPVEREDNSVILSPLTGPARKVAEQVLGDLDGEQPDDPETQPF